MTETASLPLTPTDCDLRDFPYMALDVQRLLTSQTWIEAAATPHMSHALISLWSAAWHERPAGSLPDNPAMLARLAMLDSRAWAKVRDRVLAGWVRCSDGRLYHPVVAEKALEAWLEKLAQRLASGAGNAKRWGAEFDPSAIEDAIRHAAGMLQGLAPHSRALPRAIRLRSRRDADPIPPASPPDPVGIAREKEGKGKRIGDGAQARARPKQPIPDGWRPSELDQAFAAKHGHPPPAIERMAERFANHAQQQDRRCSNWSAAWRNWVLKEPPSAPTQRREVIW